MFGKSKINLIRTVALGLVFGGLIVTYGIFLVESAWAMSLFMIIGILMVILSSVIYFWVGFISSTRALQVVCPTCHKTTKMLGKMDECMYCKQKLTVDSSLANDQRSNE